MSLLVNLRQGDMSETPEQPDVPIQRTGEDSVVPSPRESTDDEDKPDGK